MKQRPEFRNILDLVDYFPTEESCHKYLAKIRWGDQLVCPHCGCFRKIYTLKGGKLFKCADCRKPFTVRIGTIFEDSALPLQKWFMAFYLVTAHKKGISSMQLARDIGVTQKTAWFMLHRIRYCVNSGKFNKPLSGIVEMDETFVGGKIKNKGRGSHTPNKTPVIGLVERNGRVVAAVADNVKSQTIKEVVRRHVLKGTKLMTDSYSAYERLGLDYPRESVNHIKGEYVRGNVHTNTIEGFWSLLKRGLVGIYHQASRKHLDKYIDEFEYRYNTRDLKDNMRFADALFHSDGRLTYKKLIA
jgi:transposase-like protein